MINLFMIFVLISILFIFLFIIKEIFKTKICVICASISLTWILLFILYKLGYFNDIIIISLLMGGSITGLYYLAEKKIKEKFHLFRLPFLLTLIFIFYLLLDKANNFASILALLIFLWFIFIIIFLYRDDRKIKVIFKKILDCCRGW